MKGGRQTDRETQRHAQYHWDSRIQISSSAVHMVWHRATECRRAASRRFKRGHSSEIGLLNRKSTLPAMRRCAVDEVCGAAHLQAPLRVRSSKPTVLNTPSQVRHVTQRLQLKRGPAVGPQSLPRCKELRGYRTRITLCRLCAKQKAPNCHIY